MRGTRLLAALTLGCGGGAPPPRWLSPEADVARTLLSALADDSLEGRATGTAGAQRAARIVAAEMSRIGLEPGGDSGFAQRVGMVVVTRAVNNRPIRLPVLVASLAALDSFPPSRRVPGVNLIGILPGADSSVRNEYLLVSAHYDHVGIRAPINGDSIYNGADDDASGVVAVLRIADLLRRGPRPRRTIVFATWIGEEDGLLGARWFADHPIRPMAELAANLEIEMIGRPDSLAGGFGHAWLTGFERSTVGAALAAARLPIGPDRRPNQNFFARSDNYLFALLGIPAHTVSSYNLHADYHRPTDDVSRIDAGHLTAVIGATADAVRLLADGPKPEWKPGGRPRKPNP